MSSALILIAITANLPGQVARLPVADTTNGYVSQPYSLPVHPPAYPPARPHVQPVGPTVYPAHFQQDLDDPLLMEEPAAAAPEGKRPPGKPGIFQSFSAHTTWLDRAGVDNYGHTRVDLKSVWGFPFPVRERPLLVVPAFAFNFIDGPPSPDLPPRLYDATLTFRTMGRINQRWAYNLAVTPGVHSDFQQWDARGFRITGYAFAVYSWTPRVQIALGAAYLDRSDIAVLPAAGLIWTPTDDWRIELIAPRPKIARRMAYFGEEMEDWLYLSGTFGGGEYQIERSGGALDVVTLRDYRVMFGIERKMPMNAGAFLEIGWVFGRTVEYDSATPDFKPGDTALISAGVTY